MFSSACLKRLLLKRVITQMHKSKMEEKKGFSFGFSKKIENKKLEQSQLSETEKDQRQTDFITSVEDKEVNSTLKTEKRKEYVIPLITENKWRQRDQQDNEENVNGKNEEENQAVRELVEDAARQNEDWDERGKLDPNLSIPLLMKNKIPEGYETDDKLDVSLRPEEPSEADYDEIPIEHFGTAMLRGMGWKEGEGIGKKAQNFKPIEATLRPKGLGLGADRSKALQLINDTKVSGANQEEQLILKAGAFCVIQKGPHKDRYGKIEGLDEDNARVMVKLAVSGVMITQSQYSIKLVDKQEYSKYSKYLNKGKVDRYKEEKEKRSKHEDNKDRGERHKHGDDVEEERLRERGQERLREENKQRDGKRYREEKEDRHRNKKHKHSNRDSERSSNTHGLSHSSSNGSSYPKPSLWLRPQIKVRIIDEQFKKGKYFNTKVEVIDVISEDNCICRTDEGKVLEGLSQSKLETVIPRSDPAFVLLVSGKWKGQIGEIKKKDKSKCTALVQLLSDRDELVNMNYDSICEYVGDIHAEFDY